jgi:hypothetical protein
MDILKALKDKRNEHQQQINTIDAAIKLLSAAKKKHMSAASRRKMSLAAKKRWAEKKKSK